MKTPHGVTQCVLGSCGRSQLPDRLGLGGPRGRLVGHDGLGADGFAACLDRRGTELRFWACVRQPLSTSDHALPWMLTAVSISALIAPSCFSLSISSSSQSWNTYDGSVAIVIARELRINLFSRLDSCGFMERIE